MHASGRGPFGEQYTANDRLTAGRRRCPCEVIAARSALNHHTLWLYEGHFYL